ncbi:DUF1501 domain-containing protein [Pedosphaera parvula]|uniref:Twin-arginine translocation pathway signal n=1 Tax=Pedosphaera parvula (strain Ellin514) TaxID=320771 RepID=B9XGD6_PEDPL|nr:DUF1501 domain-containing protein [Pedosphaera parvula]EEF60987.1 protein of unknown function DUF1501 [Pedosphaera parvula Ellin514]
MSKEISLHTRREFLRTTVLGGALSWTVPAFLANTFSTLQADAADSATQIATGKDSTILVILQMAGGNDGLNTVVPFADDHYHKARPRIGLGAKEVLKLNDEVGLHPSLTGFKELYDSGSLAVIQGIGYPNPNRSHFRSTEIWQTASDSEKFEKYGWLGRYFDNACAGSDPTVGINIGRQMPQAFAARHPMGVSLDNPESYRFISSEKGKRNEMTASEESYRKLNQPDEAGMMAGEADGNSGGSIGSISGTVHHAGSALDFLERTAMDAQISSDKIREISKRVENKANYPQSQLGTSLKMVARLIGGSLPTRVFYVSQGGYDTHTNQLQAHQRLLKDLGDSVKAFTDDMNVQGNMQRVMVMTFSEFGRRVAENANNGTDHGAAAPMFVIGNKVKAGLLGKYPSLASGDLVNGDVKYNVDFRSVYAGLLEGWLKTSSEPVLGRKFEPLMCV